jgi:hypothetical protein
MPRATSQSKVREPGSMIRLCSLPMIRHLLVLGSVVHQRPLRLSHGHGLAHRHRLAAADVVPTGHGLLQRRFLDREERHRQPHHQEVNVAQLHHGKRPPEQRHVLGRLGVFVVQLLGTEGIGGETHVRPDLVEQRADGDAHGFLAFTGRPRRRVVARRIGNGRETGAADVGTGRGRDEFGVAGSDIHRSDDQFHSMAPR